MTTSRAGPGARVVRLSIIGCVTEEPTSPRIEISTSIAGNSDSTP
jgi:hypothetical protein